MEDYGLPGVAALNTPYGLPSEPVGAARSPQYISPALPYRAPFRPTLVPRQAPPQGMGVLRQSELPDIAAPIPGNRVVPIVGRDVSLDDFIRIHRRGESGNSYQALNKEKAGNTASGAYQYTDATWNGYAGYKKALLAPKAVQDRRYREDLSKRLSKYGGDPFKAMAEHYLPILANDPRRWGQEYKFKNGNSVKSVASYLRQMMRGTNLAEPLEQYLRSYGLQ